MTSQKNKKSTKAKPRTKFQRKKARRGKNYDKGGYPITEEGFEDTVDRLVAAVEPKPPPVRDYDEAGDPLTEKGVQDTIDRYLGH